MKIRLIIDVPVGRQHGMFKGKEFETLRSADDGSWGSGGATWVMGTAGEEVRVFPFEYERVEDGSSD